ncbi:UNVERIFIED_CONTAM: hypothetical protein H355_010761 [Colinus virginianus]|nr:hypothetical protein H355_010761 [Colinus virginianus]
MYAQDSIDFLKQSGVDFAEQESRGIDVEQFGELIMSSGLVMNEHVKWISFHGCYDFGYLLKLLTCAPLPHSEAQFFELVHLFFPALYDIKFLLRSLPATQLYWQPGRQQQQQQGSNNSAHKATGYHMLTVVNYLRMHMHYIDVYKATGYHMLTVVNYVSATI